MTINEVACDFSMLVDQESLCINLQGFSSQVPKDCLMGQNSNTFTYEDIPPMLYQCKWFCVHSAMYIQILYNFRYSVVKVGSAEIEDGLQWLHDHLTSKRHAAGRMQNVCVSFCVQYCLINLSIVEMSVTVLPILYALYCRSSV